MQLRTTVTLAFFLRAPSPASADLARAFLTNACALRDFTTTVKYVPNAASPSEDLAVSISADVTPHRNAEEIQFAVERLTDALELLDVTRFVPTPPVEPVEEVAACAPSAA